MRLILKQLQIFLLCFTLIPQGVARNIEPVPSQSGSDSSMKPFVQAARSAQTVGEFLVKLEPLMGKALVAQARAKVKEGLQEPMPVLEPVVDNTFRFQSQKMSFSFQLVSAPQFGIRTNGKFVEILKTDGFEEIYQKVLAAGPQQVHFNWKQELLIPRAHAVAWIPILYSIGATIMALGTTWSYLSGQCRAVQLAEASCREQVRENIDFLCDRYELPKGSTCMALDNRCKNKSKNARPKSLPVEAMLNVFLGFDVTSKKNVPIG